MPAARHFMHREATVQGQSSAAHKLLLLRPPDGRLQWQSFTTHRALIGVQDLRSFGDTSQHAAEKPLARVWVKPAGWNQASGLRIGQASQRWAPRLAIVFTQ